MHTPTSLWQRTSRLQQDHLILQGPNFLRPACP